MRKLTTKEFIQKSKKAHGNKYDYNKSVYVDCRTKVKIYCKSCKKFFHQNSSNHIQGYGCWYCGQSYNRSSTKEFIKKAKKIHGNKYDYSEVNYINAETKVKIYCKSCEKFFYQKPKNHLSKMGCKQCGRSLAASKLSLSVNKFIKKAKKIHGNLYNYDEAEYINCRTKVKIYCNNCCNCFYQRADIHLSGHGCTCISRSSTDDFIKKAKEIHGDLYDYSKSEYILNKTKVKIYCKSCQDFFYQRADSHLDGCGCPMCSNLSISKISQEWLDSFKNPNIIREKTIKIGKRNYIVDGYDPKTNTIYEFYGDFWHGNPDVFNPSDINPKNKTVYGELYDKTMKRHDKLIKYGYNIISVWENDWKNKE